MQASSRLTVALLAGGIATFSELYATQALLPDLADAWQVSESAAALTVSVATGALAVSVLPWAAVADRIGRARAMRLSAVVTAVIGLLLPMAPTFETLLVLRGISGLALGALPALAIAHVVELDRAGRATAVGGIYVAGTTIGGLIGRVVSGTVGGTFGWRWGTAAAGVWWSSPRWCSSSCCRARPPGRRSRRRAASGSRYGRTGSSGCSTSRRSC